jgi:hypothetical protein
MAFDKTGEMLSEIYKEGMASVTVTFELRSPPDCRAYFNSATIPCYGRNRSAILLGACRITGPEWPGLRRPSLDPLYHINSRDRTIGNGIRRSTSTPHEAGVILDGPSIGVWNCSANWVAVCGWPGLAALQVFRQQNRRCHLQ